MLKNPESEPNLLTREELVKVLSEKGIQDPEVRKKLIDYQRTLEQASYATESGYDEAPRLAIHMAKIYFEAGYKEEAIASLKEMITGVPFGSDGEMTAIELSDDVYEEVLLALQEMGE